MVVAEVGIIIEGTDGYLVMSSYSSGVAFDKDGNQVQKFDGGGDHYGNFLDAVRSRNHEELNADIEEDDEWSAEFTQNEVNGWLAEEATEEDSESIPREVRDLRVQFTRGTLLLGCRVEQPNWNGVVSLTLEPRVPEPNRLDVEIESARAGLLPVPLNSVLDRIVAALVQNGWRATRRVEQGRDVISVALDRGDTEQPILRSIELRPGVLRLSGRRRPPAVVMSDRLILHAAR